jgi:hypothetical protein
MKNIFKQLEINPVLPFSIEYIPPSAANENATSWYDSTPLPSQTTPPLAPNATFPFQNIVICYALSNEAASIQNEIVPKGSCAACRLYRPYLLLRQ